MNNNSLNNGESISERLAQERQRLLQLATKVKTRYREEQKAAMEEVGDSPDGGDSGAITQHTSEIDVSIGHLLDERFERITYALNKIENGTYGICENCGKEISPERLEVLPEATLCVDCQQQEEKRGLSRERYHEEID